VNVAVLNHTGCEPHFGCVAAMYIMECELERRYGAGSVACRIATHDSTLDPLIGPDICNPDGARQAVARLPCITAIKACNLVILNGEGTLHWRNNRGNPRAWLWLALLEQAARHGCETWALNMSLFTDDGGFLALAKSALGRATHIACRDAETAETLRRNGLPVTEAADLTFLVSSATTPEVDLAIGRRFPEIDPADDGSLLVAGSSALTAETLPAWHACLKPLCRRYGDRLRWLTQPDWQHDCELVTRLEARYGKQVKVETVMVPAETAWLVRHHRAVVSGRFHLNTFAVTAGVPAALLPGNTPKNDLLGAQLDSDSYPTFDLRRPRRIAKWLKAPPTPPPALASAARRRAALNFPSGVIPDASRPTVVDGKEYARQKRFLDQCRRMRETAFVSVQRPGAEEW
jgi:hypothetical protein